MNPAVGRRNLDWDDVRRDVEDVTPFGFDNPGFMELHIGLLALNLLSVP